MHGQILLKKYGNRRLYDCTNSTYVTLPDVEKMLQRGLDIRVVDSKTGEDITRSVLIQIILEGNDSRDVLPPNFLKMVVRFGNSPMKEFFSKSLLNYIDFITQTQNAMASQFINATPDFFHSTSFLNPFALFGHPRLPFPHLGSVNDNTNTHSQSSNWSAPLAKSGQESELVSIKSELSKTQELVRQLLENQQKQEVELRKRPKASTHKKKQTTKSVGEKTARKR